MSNPRLCDWGSIKRIGRYLMGRPRAVQWFYWQDEPSHFSVYSGSNWAGCRDTRKSTSGAALMHGGHLLKSFSRTQSNIALSSAEAELYATVTAASEGIGLTAMARDNGKVTMARMHVDATAAIGIAERKGLGKVRHLDTRALWIHDAVRRRRDSLEKVLGTENPADLMTKHLDQKNLDKLLGKLSVVVSGGRAASAPRLNEATAVSSLEESEKKARKEGSSNAWLEVVETLGRGAKWADCAEDDGEANVNSLEEFAFEHGSAQGFGLQASEQNPVSQGGWHPKPHREKGRIDEDAGAAVFNNCRKEAVASGSPGEDAEDVHTECTKYSEITRGGAAASRKPCMPAHSSFVQEGATFAHNNGFIGCTRYSDCIEIAVIVFRSCRSARIRPSSYRVLDRRLSIGERHWRMKRHMISKPIAQIGTPVQYARGEVLIMPLLICRFEWIYVCMILCSHMQFSVDSFLSCTVAMTTYEHVAIRLKRFIS